MRSCERLQMATVTPSSASAFAVASPSPLDAAATAARRPSIPKFSLVDGSRAVAQGGADAARAGSDDLGADRHCSLLRCTSSDVESDGGVDAGELVVGDARLPEALGAPAVGLARAHRAEVPHAGRQRADDRRHVELAVVGEHADRVARTELVAHLLEVAVGPLVDDLVGHREALPGGEHRARVAHDDAIAEHLRHAGERAREVDRAEDDHARRRRERLDEHRHRVFTRFAVGAVVTGRREARLQLTQRVARHDPVEVVIAEGAEWFATRTHQQLGPELGTRGDRRQRDRILGAQRVAQRLVDRVLTFWRH